MILFKMAVINAHTIKKSHLLLNRQQMVKKKLNRYPLSIGAFGLSAMALRLLTSPLGLSVIADDLSVDMGSLSVIVRDLSVDKGSLSVIVRDLSVDKGSLSVIAGDLSIAAGSSSVGAPGLSIAAGIHQSVPPVYRLPREFISRCPRFISRRSKLISR